jgi:hypothetical protein
MFNSLFLAITLVLSAPLPTPTQGLTEEQQKINYTLLTQGVLAKTAMIDGETYTVRGTQNILGLYNSNGHAIAIIQSTSIEITYALAASDGDPFEECEELGNRKIGVDSHIYTLKGFQLSESMVVTVYNAKGHIIFAMADPAAIIIPSAPMPL